jgi:hypothetical protein
VNPIRSWWPVATALAVVALFAAVVFAPLRSLAACAARATPAPSSSASPAPSPNPSEAPLYVTADDIYSVDRDVTLFYYFQGNRDGTGKVKKEFRYDRNLWNTCAQLQIRLPFITKYPIAPVTPYSPKADPYSGFGDAELRYIYAVPTKTFDHTLVVGAAFPTTANGVDNTDTELKFFYITKWKWGGAIASTNEYDQTIIRPPGSSYTSYYEQEVTLPYYSFIDSSSLKSLKISATYTGRVLFSDGSIYKSAIGALLSGSSNDFAMFVRDTWGIGGNGVWKYKVEANASARFDF